MELRPPRAARRGLSTLSLAVTLVVVMVLSAAVVRISWGVASGAGGGSRPTVHGGDSPAATLPSGPPAEVAGATVLSTHATAISTEANAVARVNGVPVEELSDDEFLAGYPHHDGTNIVTARVVARAPLRVQLELNGGAARSCVDVATGSAAPGGC